MGGALPAFRANRLLADDCRTTEPAWRRYADDPARRFDACIADILLLPLTGLMLTIFLLSTVPGASDAIADACSVACMP
jgi:hypothetical protein